MAYLREDGHLSSRRFRSRLDERKFELARLDRVGLESATGCPLVREGMAVTYLGGDGHLLSGRQLDVD